MTKRVVILCCLSFVIYTLASVCYRETSSRRSCGFWGWRSCTRYSQQKVCCGGWTGEISEGCNKALCDGKTNPDACTLNVGNVKVSASSPVITWSGGTCFEHNECTDCNDGFYADGPYCRACSQIANCNYQSCTSASDSVCHYCKGVVKDSATQYGWWAYTRWIDDGLSCKPACSWRQGHRCYPGSCSDTTVASCKCTSGFSGTDCSRINEGPTILGSSVQFKHVGDTTTELVDAPADISAPSPQDVVYTNNMNLQTANAYVDARYVKTLPPSPNDHFYVKHDASRVGIVNGGVTLKLIRGSSTPSVLSFSCPVDPPMPNNYRCNTTFSLADVWTSYTPFQHGDTIQFTTFATNGGFITIYDRENNNNEVVYSLQGRTRTFNFEIDIDTEIPEHCSLSSIPCRDFPLQVPDVSLNTNIDVKWQGWFDSLAGMDSYHFEVFHLKSTGPDESSELTHGRKVADAMLSTRPANVAETKLTLSSPGPYSITMSAFDKAGNHRNARQLIIFDNQSKVDKKGVRTTMEGSDGRCVWKETPAAPIVANANPNANCDWIVKFGPMEVKWTNHFINTRHHAGHWLHAVEQLDHVESLLDDHEGQRQTSKVDNVQGIVRFQLSYDLIYEDKTTQVPWYNITDTQSQTTTINQDLYDGMGLNITLRALDITGAHSDENIFIKADSSPPVLNNLWLTLGDMKNVSVHKAEDLALITIEWEMYDFESGIHEVQWRIYDNYTGDDIVHGSAFESPQGNTETLQHCKEEYGSYPRGDNCYCTPFDGCFHQHYQVKPLIDDTGTNGLDSKKHIGTHDYDYFIEVKTVNRAMLTTTLVKKISIDVSPPVAGSVYEGQSGSPEVDFQQDREVHVHWKDFFDKESGVLFYDYIFGHACFEENVFAVDLTDTDQLERTYLDFASFTVPSDGTYYVTVVAYNRALDPSVPVCSDGITIETSTPYVYHVSVAGARTKPGPIVTDDDRVWYLHDDREVQLVEQPSEACRHHAMYLSTSELTLFSPKLDSQGRQLELTHLNCDDVDPRSAILSYLPFLDRIELSWSTDNKVHLHNTEIGLASPDSDEPDLADFESAYHHKHKFMDHLDLVDSQMFNILIRTTSKSGVTNTQKVGPFMTDTSPPTFQGEILLSYNDDDNMLMARWNGIGFHDNQGQGTLEYKFCVGSLPRRADVQTYRDLTFNEKCLQTETPTCTVVDIQSLDGSFHHLHDYYITIKATDQMGLSVTAVSSRYTHDVFKPTQGVVLDVASPNYTHQRHDDDFQKSTTVLKGEWFGFESSHSSIDYTICQAKDMTIVDSTCKDVGLKTNGELNGLNLEYFMVYQLAVIARSPGGNVTIFSDGVMPVDTHSILNDILLFDGSTCEEHTDDLPDRFTHHELIVNTDCQDDLEYQRSLSGLSAHWTVPDRYVPFTPDVYWKIQQRAPIAEHWEDITGDRHLMTSSSNVSTKVVLESGRAYRFMLTFCADAHCFPSLYTDGVTVTRNPPKTGFIGVEYATTDSETKLKVTMDKYVDPDIEDPREAVNAMSHYEWAITDDDHAGRVIDEWKVVTDMNDINEQQVSFEVGLNGLLTFNKCWRISIRGYNKAGLYSTISKDIHPCTDGIAVRNPIVLDYVGPSRQLEDGTLSGVDIAFVQNTLWTDKDKDYTPYDNIISAVWPTVRYRKYSYAVIELANDNSILFYKEVSSLDIRRPCDVPNAIGCGYTDQNFINVHTKVAHGKRYTVCIHANATTLHYENWDEDLQELSVCSDGITVDMTSPTPGSVHINGPNSIYQRSLTDIYVIWESFVDVEELSNAPHSTGISHYEVALGTHIGDSDVHGFVNVNITNHHRFNSLNLQNGHRYYATVKGLDFTGRLSMGYSTAIITDNTPPKLSNASISTGGRHISDKNGIHICWPGLFSDAESGITVYEYGIGSRAAYDDIHPYTDTTQECADTKDEGKAKLEEGHVYFISVRATNGAGLSTTASSLAYIVDYSPPDAGFVFDGLKSKGKDVDFQTDKHTLRAFWSGFHDPHTNIEEYFVQVGTEMGSSDIVVKQSVGIKEEIDFNDLHLREGRKYYITVSACNTADMCTSVSSDGLSIDSSAPVPGSVKDGSDINDIEYQSSRTFIACKWYNFVDAQSNISHYTWRLGVEAGTDDIVPTMEVVASANEVVIPDIRTVTGWKTLPPRTKLYSTVRAYNKAGLWSELTSNGFEVDNTKPVFVEPLTHVPIGSLKPSTSLLNNMLKVTWEVEDRESYINKQYITIVSHRGEDFNVSVQIPGLVREYTFSDISLHDGSVYDIMISSCNCARFCAKSSIDSLLVDSSSPTPGTFAIHTDHAANLHRQREWMTWSEDSVTLALVGFSDEHSGISGYYINIGSRYMDSDLSMAQGGTVYVSHNGDTRHVSNDGGKVQIFTIQTKDLTTYQHVFVTVWAENGVGHTSKIVHSQIKLIPGGLMELVRRCSSYSCQGHCVCAAQDQKCPTDLQTEPCKDVTTDPTFASIRVKDKVNMENNADEMTHSPTSRMLAANWEVDDSEKIQPVWYEWSAGIAEDPEPQGIFTSTERIWHDAARGTTMTFTLKPEHSLHENVKYSVFVRAWYDGKMYATVKSPGVVVNTQIPQITNMFGKSVKEVSSSSSSDIDVSNETQPLFIDWTGTFKDTFGILSTYNTFISTTQGGHGYSISQDAPATTTRVDIPIEQLKPGVRYYSNVQAYTLSGLHACAVSDGILIDTDIPRAGVVLDGTNELDLKYQNQSGLIAANWHGFTDIQSSIVSYTWCVSRADRTGSCDIVSPTVLGMATSVSQPPKIEIENGQMIVNEVVATDSAGHTSERVLSNGVIMDRTPPVIVSQANTGENLIRNPSFEEAVSPIELSEFKPTISCSSVEVRSWNAAECISVVTGKVKEGSNALWVRGNISQTLQTATKGHTYSLEFYVAHFPSNDNAVLTEEVFVQFGDDRHLFKLHSKPGHSGMNDDTSWQMISGTFQARNPIHVLLLGTMPRSNGILIDSVVLTEMSEGIEDDAVDIKSNIVLVHGFSSIHASWKCADPESGIRDHTWAIGTVRGGNQFQDFTSVGTRQFGTNSKLSLPHQTVLHITVVATNGVGMKTVFYSEPLLVDRTPPIILGVNDGPTKDEDLDFQGHGKISFTFDVSDDESGVKECSWALGTLDTYNSIFDYRKLPENARAGSGVIPVDVDMSRPLYVTVECMNNVGLIANTRSDGVQILMTSPDTDDVVLDIIGSSGTRYPPKDEYQGRPGELQLRWSGFKPTDGIDFYKIDVVGETYQQTIKVTDTGTSSTFVKLVDLPVEQGHYSCILTGVNGIGLTSAEVIKNFTLIRDSPDIIDVYGISITWNPATEVTRVDWQRVFSSPHDLYYEVSIGTSPYGADVVMWQETLSTHIDFTLTRATVGEFGKEIYVIVTAISPAGTYETVSTNQLITDVTQP